MSLSSATASSSDSGTFPTRQIITGLDRLRGRLNAVNDWNGANAKLRQCLRCFIPNRHIHSGPANASGPASAKFLDLTEVLRGAARFAGELSHGNQVSHHATNRRVLCEALANHIPAEYFDDHKANILDQLIYGAIKFFHAHGLGPTPENAHSLPSVPSHLQDCLPRGPVPRITFPALRPVSSQDTETKATLEQFNPSTECDGADTDALKTSVNRSLHLLAIPTSSGQRTSSTTTADKPNLATSHGSLVAPAA